MIDSIEWGDFTNGIKYHHIPKINRPAAPSKDNFEYLTKVLEGEKV